MADLLVSLHKDEAYQPSDGQVNTCMKLYPFDIGHIKEFQALPGNI